MMDSTTYRGLAEQCLSILGVVTSDEGKANLIAMAQCWHRLAQEAEERERGDVVWIDPPPAVER
jgi:hypothetical protein